MGTRWFLALLSLFFMLLAPVTSFPAKSTEQSHKSLAGVASFLRMLKDHIVRGTDSRGTLRGVKGRQVSPKVKSLNIDVLPAWPPKPKAKDWSLELDMAPKEDLSNLANDSDRDLPPEVVAAVGSTELEDDKRGNDYGHGFFFGKRVPKDIPIDRQPEEPTMHRQRRPDDYNWGMWFGKRDKADMYGWGGFFGKRSGDVIDYEDFVA